jgi:tetratricopeptide (TPR) repeat protein
MMRGMVPLALPLLLLAAAAQEGKAAPAPKPADPQEKEFTYYLSRARELATQAASTGDPRVGQEAFDSVETGDGGTAVRMLNAVFAVAPESGAFHFLKGCLLQGRAEYLDAKAEFGAAKGGDFRVAQAELRYFQCSVGLGLQLGEANQYDAAVKILTEAIALKPNDKLIPIAYYNLGVAHRRLQAVKEAEKVFRLSMERFPSYAPSYGELGDMLTELDRFDDAILVLDQAVKVDPTYSRGWLLKANTQTTRGRFKEAEEAFLEYERRKFPPSGLSEFYRGLYHQKKMEPALAVERLQRALALDPGMIRAIYYLSLCHRDLGEEEKAAAYMDKWKAVEAENRRKGEEMVRRALEKAGPPPKDDRDGKQGKDPKDGDGR